MATNSTPSTRKTLRKATVGILRRLGLNRRLADIYYRHMHGFASAGDALPDVVRACLEALRENGLAEQGDYCEFGVFKGHTLLSAQTAADSLAIKRMRFFGFDSFEGLPEPTGIDRTPEEHFYKGQYRCSLEDVRKQLDRRGADWNRMNLIKGFFDETLNERTRRQLGLESVVLALVDCDLYSSTVAVLDFLRPLLLDGSIVVMDDWNAFDSADDRGQRRALTEFVTANPNWTTEPSFGYGAYGQVFVVRLSD